MSTNAIAGALSQTVDPRTFGSYRRIVLLAGPLIFSHMGVMLMQVVDGLFVARYSKSAIAAIGPAAMVFWLLCGLFIGLVGYSSAFVAQYVGAGRPKRVGAAVWQGIYLAVAAAAVLGAAVLAARPIFDLAGHEPAIRRDEVAYFAILCYGGLAFMLSAALSSFFAGRNDNVPLMMALVIGNLVNALGAYVLVFGRWGLPELGIRGAAWATVLGQASQAVIMALLFLRPGHRRDFGTWRDRRIEPALMWRMCTYGLPNGVRYVIEILAWTVFILILGRVDSSGLAATNIVWRVYGLAIFPVLGLSSAVSMLVGQAQGAGRPDLSRRVTYRGLVLGQLWMAAAALLILAMPGQLMDVFLEPGAATDLELRCLSIRLLHFIAVYCLIDGVNMLLMAVLAGAGDTRWLLIVSGGFHAGYLGALLVLARCHAGVYAFWLASTVFVCAIAVAWIARFRSARWEHQRVIEHAPVDIETTPVPGA